MLRSRPQIDRPAARNQKGESKPGSREERAISNLDHTHFCSPHDMGRRDGVGCLVMDGPEDEILAPCPGLGCGAPAAATPGGAAGIEATLRLTLSYLGVALVHETSPEP